MNIGQSLYNLIEFIYTPMEYVLTEMGLDTIVLKLGIGQVEFFSLTVTQLLSLALSVVVWYIFIRFVYKLIKSIIGLFTRYLR